MSYTFDQQKPTILCEIMGNFGSDKGNKNLVLSWHNYTTFYYSIFKDLQDKPLRIFELGLGTNNVNIPSNMGVNGNPGASLYGWEKFFYKSKIFGADIDKDILFQTSNIKTFYCDQTDPEKIKNLWNNIELNENFDIIIDDGLHTFDANVCFFENSIHKLKNNGYYIIEDVLLENINFFEKKINDWKIKFSNLKFEILQIYSSRNKHDNNLIVIFKNN